MPKGIYPRNSKPIAAPAAPSNDMRVNKVMVSQMPERQSANANVETIRQTQGDETISTTERLFGDIALRDQLDEQDPNRSNEVPQDPLKELPTPIPVPQNPEQAEEQKFKEEPKASQPPPPAPENSTPKDDEFLDWETMANKKIRQKIDGKEVIVTAEELKKYSDQDQIKKHLAEAADRVGEERRKLAEERKQMQELRQKRQGQYEAPLPQENGNQAPPEPRQPQPDYSNPFLQRIEFLEAQLQQLAQGTQPVIYQSNRQRVADELRGQGFTDFIDYIPKMEMHMTSVKDPQLANFYDTPQGAKALYFQLKAVDMKAQPATPPPAPLAPVVPRRAPTPPQTQIDGGSAPSGSSNDDSGHTYRAAFRRAISLGDDREAWNEVLRQKGILPE